MTPNNASEGVELLPCPFCGGEAMIDGGTHLEYHGRSHVDVYVECQSCGARGQEFADADPDVAGYANAARQAWNTRAAREGGWRGIESAPRDGEVLACSVTGRRSIEWGQMLRNVNTACASGGERPFYVGWMPLPSALQSQPAGLGAGGGG